VNQWTFYLAASILAAAVAIFSPDEFDHAVTRLSDAYHKFTSTPAVSTPAVSTPAVSTPAANPNSSKSVGSAIYTYYAEIRKGVKA
jgi:hypothetical protein